MGDTDRELEALRTRVAELGELEVIGEAAEVVAHDLRNHLNGMQLQVTLVQLKCPPELKNDLALVRSQVKAASDLLNKFQQHRQRGQVPAYRVDLNAVVRAERPDAHLADGELPVSATASDLRRLVGLLAAAPRALGAAGGEWTTERTDKAAVLRCTVPAATLTTEQADKLFDPYALSADGLSGLELTAAKAIVRRLRGRMASNPLPAGGVEVTAEIPLAASS